MEKHWRQQLYGRPAKANHASGAASEFLRATTDITPPLYPQHGPLLLQIPNPKLVKRSLTSVAITTGQKGNVMVPTERKKSGKVTVKFKMKSPSKTTRDTLKKIRILTPTPSVGDSYFSDTDEEEGKPSPNGRTSTQYVINTCKQVYKSSCSRLNIVPRNHFIKQMGLKLISLRDEGLSRKEVNAICASLVSYEKLFTLDFSGNILPERCVGYVCQLLERNSYITDLVLSECDITTEGLTELTSVLPKIIGLHTVDLSGNKFKDDDGPALSHLILEAQDLSCLKLHHNELRETGGVCVGDALAQNDGLEKMDLSWNHLRGRGAECIGLALMKNTTLTHLNLAWNGIGFEGCCAIAHGLQHNTTLTDLDLTCNRIHPPALFELLKGVLTNKTLIVLRLGRNPIPAPMTSAILARFRDAKEMALTTLDFTGIIVDKLFEVVLDEIRDSRNFECYYERALAIHKAKYENLDDLTKGVLNIDPVRILFFLKKNLRIIDLFRQIDTDNSGSVSRDEFRKALLKEDLPLSSGSLDKIMDFLDTNKDGEIDLLTPENSYLSLYEKEYELSDGERRFKRHTISEKQNWKAQERLAIEEAQGKGIAADLGGQGARFSRSFRPDLTDLHGESKEALHGENAKKRERKDDGLRLPKINDIIQNDTSLNSLTAQDDGVPKMPSIDTKLPNTTR